MITKTILFDFGGTLDLDGVHWYDQWTKAYKQCGVEWSEADFRKAYFYAEENLNAMPAVDYTYKELLRFKTSLQFHCNYGNLISKELEAKSIEIADSCFNDIKENVCKTKLVLDTLVNKYDLGVVSNFYGNLNIVLKELELDKYFKTMIDSKIVNIRKPSPDIFLLAAGKMNAEPNESIFIGDSYKQDIIPSKAAGFKTIFLKNDLINKSEFDKADMIITSFSELSKVI